MSREVASTVQSPKVRSTLGEGTGNPGFPHEDGATLLRRNRVNRFFRSALFPLIVIVLLVYLASQTL